LPQCWRGCRWGFWLLSDIDVAEALKEKLVDAADLGSAQSGTPG
jgi:hypothetical protein